jgi:hypothetical protein
MILLICQKEFMEVKSIFAKFVYLLYCGVFTPYKNRNFETRSRDYVTVDEAMFSPCRAAPRFSLSDNCKRLDRSTVRMGHVTFAGTAVTSHTHNAVTQQWRKMWFSACQIKGL